MFGLGMSEMILLGVIALVVIGPKELPGLARTIGRFINELKRSTDSLTDEIKQQTRVDFLSDYNNNRDNQSEHNDYGHQPHDHETSEHFPHMEQVVDDPEPEQLELIEEDKKDEK